MPFYLDDTNLAHKSSAPINYKKPERSYKLIYISNRLKLQKTWQINNLVSNLVTYEFYNHIIVFRGKFKIEW